jgi:hypothetical protein
MQGECFGVKFLDPKRLISFDIQKTAGCHGIVALGRVTPSTVVLPVHHACLRDFK